MANIDPIELEVFTTIFSSITSEMGAVFKRAAGSSNLQERCDYSCAIFDKNCRIVTMEADSPLHLGPISLSVKEAVNSLRLQPGDVAILNDPYAGGSHLHGMTMISALYEGNQKTPEYYLAVRTHYLDTGGLPPLAVPLDAEVFQEGVIIPPIKLYAGGTLNRTLLQMILYNSRIPRKAESDLAVQLEALRLGENRVCGLLKDTGSDMVGSYSSALRSRTENLVNRVVERLPDGTYSAEDFLDDDGSDRSSRGNNIALKVKLTVKGSDLTVDFTGTSAQVESSLNTVISVTTSAVCYILNCIRPEGESLLCSLPPSVRIIAPEGSIVNASFPAAVNAGSIETSQRITDLLLKAFASALPDEIPAAGGGSCNSVAVIGIRPDTGRPFSYHESIGSGCGGGPLGPGRSACRPHLANTFNTSIEILEHFYPFRIGEFHLREKSGGSGKNPGGEGLVRSYEATVDNTEIRILAERRRTSPFGLKGGRVGKKGTDSLIPEKGSKRKLKGKDSVNLSRGDRVVVETPGGGGWGKSR